MRQISPSLPLRNAGDREAANDGKAPQGTDATGVAEHMERREAMSEHTPGPWEINLGMRPPRIYAQHESHTTIVDLPHWLQEHWPEREANAHLIAAAPDLVVALEAMVEEKCDYMRINNLGDCLQQHTVKQSLAALAKSRGKL